MSDEEKLAHDLALVAAAISANKNFSVEAVGSDSDERRDNFADYLRQEYDHFLKHYLPDEK